jgi:hypothetical protein
LNINKIIYISVLKEYPEFTPSEVATYMNKQWKLLSSDERQFYRNLANQKNQNVFTSPMSEISKKTKYQITQAEKDKNRKQFISMLGNMKTNKAEVKSESIIMRSFISWNINISSVATKFRT